jgi:prevent-host-death family protein
MPSTLRSSTAITSAAELSVWWAKVLSESDVDARRLSMMWLDDQGRMLARVLSLDGVPPLPHPTLVQAVLQIHGVFAERPEVADCHLAFGSPGPEKPQSPMKTARGRGPSKPRCRNIARQGGAFTLRLAGGSLPWSNHRPQRSIHAGWSSTHCKSCLTDRGSVTRIMVMSTQSLAAVKAHFSKVIDDVAGTHERVTVTKNGSPVAVILAVEDFDSLLETLEILSDRSAVADIREAEQQMAQGQVFSEEQVRAAVTNRSHP